MNIFLGIFEPSMYNYPIWDLASDCYLHDAYIMQPWKMSKRYIEWLDSKLFRCLPLPYEQRIILLIIIPLLTLSAAPLNTLFFKITRASKASLKSSNSRTETTRKSASSITCTSLIDWARFTRSSILTTWMLTGLQTTARAWDSVAILRPC